MLENINPMLIIAIVGIVIVIGLIFYFKPFGIGAFTNVKERFDGLTELNKKLFEKITPMVTPNVVYPNKSVTDIPPNSANVLTNIIFPELNKQVEERPVEERPAEETPVEEKPVDEKTAEETPVEEKPVEEKTAEETPVEEKPAEEKPVEEKPAEEKPAEETKFVLPEMVAPAEEPESVILPSPKVPEVQTPESAEQTEAKPFILPSTILTEQPQETAETKIDVPSEMKELEMPVERQSPFELPSIINTAEQPIVPQNDTSLLASLEEQNKPVDVASIVSEIPSSDVPQNSAELIKQQVEQPVLQRNVPSVTISGVENPLSNGVVNQFKNTRILGAFPMQ